MNAYNIGPLTMRYVFEANGIENVADMQSVWDAVEAAFERQTELLTTAREALENIAEWEMPQTGKFWDNDDGSPSDRPMSYAACYGSNGEREVIRAAARTALSALETAGE